MNRSDLESVPRRLPKLIGADVEVANFILGLEKTFGTGPEASRALLSEIEGFPGRTMIPPPVAEPAFLLGGYNGGSASSGYSADIAGSPYEHPSVDNRDWGRRFLSGNGGCSYIDLDHLELCVPEAKSAYDHLACWRAMLTIARRAMASANQKLPAGQRLQVLLNNSDGQGHSYGSHFNFLITRKAWENIFYRKLHYLVYLAGFQASSIVYTGQGKVGSENNAPAVSYQLSQRADFTEVLTGAQTTFNRPLVNSRDEALCGPRRYGEDAGPEQNMARLHVIFFDNTLCQVAHLLKVGVMQIILAMIEAERVSPDLTLDDPLDALLRWSHDPSLQARATLTSGEQMTAVEMQLRFLEEASRFVEAGECEGLVPRVEEILTLWEDTLLKLEAGSFCDLATRIDWVLKQSLLERVLERRPDLDWQSPELKHLDQIFSSLDPEEGIFWSYEKQGLVEILVGGDEVEHFLREPPEDTRAWTRAMLLRSAGRERVQEVDWDSIRFKRHDSADRSDSSLITLGNPLGFTRSDTQQAFESGLTFEELLESLGGHREPMPSGCGWTNKHFPKEEDYE